MIELILGIVKGGIDGFNKWMGRQIKLEDQNTGRKLQNADNLEATAKANADAQNVREDVAAMSDADLDNELRPHTSARHK